MRMVVGIGLVSHAVLQLETGPPLKLAIAQLSAIALGFLLLLGFWTPIVGLLVTLLEIWDVVTLRGDVWTDILLATIGLALALIGPGAISIDALRFGWKRIDIREHKK